MVLKKAAPFGRTDYALTLTLAPRSGGEGNLLATLFLFLSPEPGGEGRVRGRKPVGEKAFRLLALP